MDSSTKTKLTEQQISDIAFHAFGKLPDRVDENNFGEFSVIYMITVDGREFVLKVAPNESVRVLRYETHVMHAEVEALELVKAHGGVPVPDVIVYDTSRTLCDSDYFIMSKITGGNFAEMLPQLDDSQKASIMFQMGQMNRVINEITHDRFGLLAQPEKQTDSWKAALSGMFSDLLNDGRDVGAELPVPYGQVESVIRTFIGACDDVRTPRLVHWDLWQGNVLVDGGRISGIIDFERALWADPLMEYCFRRWMDNGDFVRGYGIDMHSLDKNAQIRLALYDLYYSLVWIVEYCFRKPDDSSGYPWKEQQFIASYQAFERF